MNRQAEGSTSAGLPRRTPRMAGWIFVSMLLAAATLLSAVSDGPRGLTVSLAVVTGISAVAGALLCPDRKAAADDTDGPGRAAQPHGSRRER